MSGRSLPHWLTRSRATRGGDAEVSRQESHRPAAPATAEGPVGVDHPGLEEFLSPLDAQARVVVLTRQGCHLCGEALNLVQGTCEPGSWAALDVEDHPALKQRYTDHVPVVFVDGKLLSYWTLRPEQLSGALAGADWSSPPGL